MKVALVTGATRGIGRACAERLAADGFRVVMADRSGAEGAAAEVPGAEPAVVDLSDPSATVELAESVLATHGRCDVLVNNAAHLGRYRFAQLGLDTWRSFHAVNVEAPFLLCSVLVPAMVSAGGGRVVNIISNTVWAPPGPGMVAYVTTKGAMLGFTRALAVEYGGSGVTVNAVAPGLTPTPGSLSDTHQSAFDQVREQQAIDRQLSTADIAGAVAYLVSDDATAVTGQSLRVDGGLVTL